MLKLGREALRTAVSRVLCIGAHSDDIEIGCGGTILTLLDQNPDVEVEWVVLSASGSRAEEARNSAALFLRSARKHNVRIRQYRERYFPFSPEMKEFFDELGHSLVPDLVFTPWREDAHQDHRTVAQLTANTFRDQVILEYEIPKYDGDLGRPNAYVHLTNDQAERKVEGILRSFPSQGSRAWFTADTFHALMRLRGVESRAPEGYAEAFHAYKVVLA